MQTIRPDASRTQHVFQTRLRSEAEARSSRPVQNRLLASSLLDLLQERKSATSTSESELLAQKYGIDLEKLQSVARFVNSPSIDEQSVKKTVGEDGVEQVTMKAAWMDPKLQGPAPLQVPSGH